MGVSGPEALLEIIRQKQDLSGYRERHWAGSFADYVEIVLENPEDPLGTPAAIDLCAYRVNSDSWEWRPESLKYMPEKIRLKFEVAGIDPDQLVRDVIEDGWT